MLTLTQFDRTTTLVADDDLSTFRVELDPSWASLRGVHGGYLTALAVRAAESVAPGRDVRTVTTSFLRPARIGPATITAEVVRQGRTLSTIHTMLLQDDRPVATTRVTSLEPVDGIDWSTGVPARPADISQAVPFAPPPTIRHFAQAELLIDPATVPTGDGSHPVVAGHVRPLEARHIDAAWLTMIGDWFPPSPFRRLQPPAGGVSIDYTVHVHRTVELAPDEWLEGVFEASTSAAGLALERGMLMTSDGVPVAETFHSRWTG